MGKEPVLRPEESIPPGARVRIVIEGVLDETPTEFGYSMRKAEEKFYVYEDDE